MKKLFFILSLGIIALNLTSCLPTGTNRQEVSLQAVFSYNLTEGLPSILTVAGEFAAPGLASSDLEIGECLNVHITLDWDNQPAGASIYYASNIYYEPVGQNYNPTVQSDFDETETVLPASDLLPIQSFAPLAYHPILEGKFFLYFTHLAPQKQDMKYIAIVKPNSEESADEPVDVYIIAQKTNSPDTSNMLIENVYAIDMNNVIRELGEVATYKEASVEYSVKELKIRLNYCTGLDENDIPAYSLYQYSGSSSTITLSVYN